MAKLRLSASLSDVNTGKVRLMISETTANPRILYTSNPLVAPFFARLLKEKPFQAFIEIRKYKLEARVIKVTEDHITLYWNVTEPGSKTPIMGENMDYRPQMWEHFYGCGFSESSIAVRQIEIVIPSSESVL